MSSTIWTQCAGPSRLGHYSSEVWRVVESQYATSTRKLVDSRQEHDLLERLLDREKPAVPPDCADTHYLLSTPFRYPPLNYGSRFGSKSQRSLWYGGEDAETALGETAFYRFWFLRDTTAHLTPIESEFTAFRARVTSEKAIDLTAPPFSAHSAQLSSRTSFAESQQLGETMREAGVEAFRYFSARRPPGICVGVLTCKAFVGAPFGQEQWHCYLDDATVEFSSTLPRKQLVFPLEMFLLNGELPPRPC
jgi:hypothetical protein